MIKTSSVHNLPVYFNISTEPRRVDSIIHDPYEQLFNDPAFQLNPGVSIQ